jgi:dolichol-phosphate mannosyltransferase/undecaprenyl-phosphate 4-deoxy-4-formamido-L-arabinose transferase
MTSKLYSVVVPVYRSEPSLLELYERTCSVFQQIGLPFELILVEDGGGDNSWTIMLSLRKRDERVKIIRLTKNFGQHNALMCGLSLASGDFVITMDDDLQNPPEEIPKLILAIESSDYDVVYGISGKKKQSLIRNIGSYLFRYLVSSIFREMPRFQLSSFRIIRKDAVEHILKIPTPNPLVGLLLLKVTDRIGSVETQHDQRKYGKTNYNPIKLVQHFLNGILYHSTAPLKGICVLGIFTSSLSVVLGIYYFYHYLTGQITIHGWISIILLILFFFGVLMFSVGIIGEYLLRIIQEVNRVPAYLIKDREI